MATVDKVEFNNFKILFGDGADPEVFTPRCTINLERGFTLTPSYNDIELPDCADDNLPSVIFKAMTSVAAEVSGAGVMEAADAEFFSDLILNNSAVNVKVVVGTVAAGRQWSFPAKSGPFAINSSKNGVVNADVSIMSHGSITSGPVT